MTMKEDAEKYELNDKWKVYFHAKNNSKKYNENTIFLSKISTIDDIWSVFNNIPSPVELFSNNESIKKITIKNSGITKELTNALSVFREDSYPQWEHTSNMNGYEWSFKKYKDIKECNSIWNELIAYILGEDIEHSEFINGFRIVDCSNQYKTIYRVEIWIKAKEHKEHFHSIFKDFFKLSEHHSLMYRDHNTLKETNKTY